MMHGFLASSLSWRYLLKRRLRLQKGSPWAQFQPTSRTHLGAVPIRSLSIHEHLSMEILKGAQVAIPDGAAARTAADAEKIARSIDSKEFVVKAMILAGGRGRGVFDNGFRGGVHIASTPEKVAELASNMLNRTLITKQTGKAGKPCNQVLVCEKLNVRKEYYFAITMDRTAKGPLLIGSSRGGVNIEEVAVSDPSAIISLPVDVFTGLQPIQAEGFASHLGFTGSQVKQAAVIMERLYQLFINRECTLIEINPLCELDNGQVKCMDCKMLFDPNSLYRQPDLIPLRDTSQEDPREVEAASHDLSYISLDGDIGCLVNGAGLAMATMDIIKLYGGEPANFLDVGGGASPEQVKEAFKLICYDHKVKAVFVNIFGGIMQCDIVAGGVINASRSLDLNIPVVVRLQGTNMNKAKSMFADSGLRIYAEDEFDKAAQLVVKMAQTGH